VVVVQQGSQSLGLIVDSVDEVTIIPDGAVEPVSAIVQTTHERQLLLGVARLEERLVLLIDLAKVVAHDDLEALGTLVAA
jgi:purine-binding chemotaxis protein CheW